MNPVTGRTIFRLCDLPPELILEIVGWAQRIWHAEIFSPKDPQLGTRRHFVSYRRFPSRLELCCRGSGHDTVPACLAGSHLAVAPSPAQIMSTVGRGLRVLLLNGNKWLWKLDNTFYKAIAERSGVESSVGSPDASSEPLVVKYRSRTLVAQNVCSCLILGLRTFYASLEMVKLALPWGRPNDPTMNVAVEVMGGDHLTSPLRHFDLELYHSNQALSRPVIRGMLSPSLLTCRCINVESYFYSPVMTHLFIQHPVDREPSFNSDFTDALAVCASSLESLTVDACRGRFHQFDDITLPRLRFFRLVGPSHSAHRLLQHLKLPADVQLHLEPVVIWRRAHRNDMDCEVKLEPETVEIRHLWRYASALAFPNHTGTIFQMPAHVQAAAEDVWPCLNTAAINIRLDPSTSADERACARFPEYVGLAFATSIAEMTAFLSGQCRDWYHPTTGSVSTVRSLGVRDAYPERELRESFHNPRLVKPLYDVVRHVIHTAISDRPGTVYAGLPGVRHLVVHSESFIPAFSLGWAHILDDFRDIEDLIILCAGVPQGTVFTDNMEGCLDIAHLDALGLYLNGKDKGAYPCPFLRRIELPSYTAALDGGWTTRKGLEGRMNSVLRVEVLGRRIAVACT